MDKKESNALMQEVITLLEKYDIENAKMDKLFEGWEAQELVAKWGDTAETLQETVRIGKELVQKQWEHSDFRKETMSRIKEIHLLLTGAQQIEV